MGKTFSGVIEYCARAFCCIALPSCACLALTACGVSAEQEAAYERDDLLAMYDADLTAQVLVKNDASLTGEYWFNAAEFGLGYADDGKLAAERNQRADALASTILSRERLRSLLDAELRESDVEAVSQEEIERLREDEMLAKYFGAEWLEEHHA